MIKASPLEFRFRFWLHLVILVLGFAAPWTRIYETSELEITSGSTHVWGILATAISSLLGGSNPGGNFLLASNLVLGLGIFFALLAAFLRTWGSAYLGESIVQSGSLHLGQTPQGVTQDGPYRHFRNPLYLGTFVHTLALALLMPRTGAIFAVVAMALLQFRLIGAEEHYLEQTLGQSYEDYYDRVPSLVPTLRPAVPATGIRPHWGQAFLGEIYFWGVAAAFAAGGWVYNQNVILMGVLISFGVSLIVLAFLPRTKA